MHSRLDKHLMPTVKLTLEARLLTLNRRRLPPFLFRLRCFAIVRRWRPADESGARDVLTDLPSDVAESREVHAEFSSGTWLSDTAKGKSTETQRATKSVG